MTDHLTLADPHLAPGASYAVVSAGAPTPLPEGPALDLSDLRVAGLGRSHDLTGWLAATHSTSLLVLHRGAVVAEWYAEPYDADTRWLGASMTKSVLALLVGLAVGDRRLDVADRVVDHVPELDDPEPDHPEPDHREPAGGGWSECRVSDLLSMTTGADWTEDHRDPDGPAARLLACFVGTAGESRALLTRVGRGGPAGVRFEYSTADSQVLDWVRERATGDSFDDALARLWSAIGAGDDAMVATDSAGVALAGGGLAATTRDWGRLGLLAREGTVAGRPVLAESWTAALGVPALPFLASGRLPVTISSALGFGRHWWPLEHTGRRLAADGSRGQVVYVDRDADVVVVRTAAWPHADPWVDRACRDLSYLGLTDLVEVVAGA